MMEYDSKSGWGKILNKQVHEVNHCATITRTGTNYYDMIEILLLFHIHLQDDAVVTDGVVVLSQNDRDLIWSSPERQKSLNKNTTQNT